jgi:hypothetical protein
MIRSIAAAAAAAVFAVVVASSSLAGAQTIYAPVQYQYGVEQYRYYYGGADSAVFNRAERVMAQDQLTDIPHTSPRYTQTYLPLNLIGQLDRVYSDVIPSLNARPFGYLQRDAANDAYANAPRYFRMADLDAAAVALPDGSRVVPPQARPVEAPREARAASRPASEIKPKAIIIIPKGDKAKPRHTPGDVQPASDKLMADASH